MSLRLNITLQGAFRNATGTYLVTKCLLFQLPGEQLSRVRHLRIKVWGTWDYRIDKARHLHIHDDNETRPRVEEKAHTKLAHVGGR